MTDFERRKFLRLGVATVAGALLPLRRVPAAESGAFQFIVVNDLHSHSGECEPWFAAVFAAMRESAPQAAFCLVAGDLADEGKPEQLAAISRVLRAAAFPCHSVPGNHDWTSKTDRSAYEDLFPGAVNFRFEHAGWEIIGLDTTENTAWNQTSIGAPALRWLDAQLGAIGQKKPVIVFTHFPLGEGVKYRPLNAGELLGKLASLNVRAVFSGHWHGYTEWANAGVAFTTDRCCSRYRDNHDGTPEKGWFVCEARDGKVSRRFVELPPPLRTHGLAKA